MADFPSPTDATQIGQVETQRIPFGQPGQGRGSIGRPTGIPETDKWLADFQQRSYGRQIDAGDRQLIDQISSTMTGRRLFVPPVYQPGRLDLEPQEPTAVPYDPLLALRHGFGGSTIGALRSWAAIDGASAMQADPSYDVFADKQIKDSPFKDQLHLFASSGSEQETAWRIAHLGSREREARMLSRMGGGGIFEVAGGMLGDPLNFLPATLGIKAATLAGRTSMLAAPETVALGFKPVIWGGLTDGMRAGAAQAGIALVDAGAHSALDPSYESGSLADIVTLPGAIAASVGTMVGAHGRYTLGMDAVARATGNHNFLAGTRASARNLPAGEGPAAPGVLSAAERTYWEKAAAANPGGRFHVDGRVMGWEGDQVLFRTSEGIDVKIAAKDIDVVSEKAARGIAVSARQLVQEPALMGSAMKLDGEFLGGGIPKVYRQGEDVVAPGTLHTDYTAMRATEMANSGMIDGLRHTADFDEFLKGNLTVKNDGTPEVWYHGSNRAFTSFDGMKPGSRAKDPGAVEGIWFSSDPKTASSYATANPDGSGTHQFHVVPAYLRLTNPLNITDLVVQAAAIGANPQKVMGDAIRHAKAAGHDGVIIYSTDPFVGALKDTSAKGLSLKGLEKQGFKPAVNVLVFDTKNVRHLDQRYDVTPHSAGPRSTEGMVARTIPNEDPRGQWDLETTDGTKLHARDFAVGTKIAAQDGGEFTVVAGDGVSTAQAFRRSGYGEREPAGSRLVDKEFKPGELESLDDVEIAQGGGSLSAGGVGTATSRKAQLVGNRMAATGIGLERLPFDVLNRAASSMLTTWQRTVEDMLSSGGRLRVKNQKGGSFESSALPVEILIRTQWLKPSIDVIRAVRDEWQLHRAGHTPVNPTDFGRVGFEVKTAFTDATGQSKGMRFETFRRRVGDALINGDKDFVTDAATPQVEAAAARTRQLLERVKREGTDVGLFKEGHEKQLADAEAHVAFLQKSGAPPAALKAAEDRVEHIKSLLSDVIAGGPKVKTAPSYRPRFWLVDQLRDRADEFKQIVEDWLRKDPGLSAQQRKDLAVNIHETLLHDRPQWEKAKVDKMFDELATPGSARARTFEIPDTLVKDFLENDAEAIVRSHVRQMGTAIEMHRRFGSTGLEAEQMEIRHEASLLFAAATTNDLKRQVTKQRDLALADLAASRDRLYGVYGAPEDPHRWSSRAVRMAKQFTNLTTLGMSGVTALSDLIRPVMTEGLQAVHDYGFRTLASDVRGTILTLSRAQLEAAGDAMELINNTRALSMSDAGDMFRSRSTFERGLAKSNSWFFVMNGLNAVNQLDKEWAGVIIQGNVNKAIQTLYSGGKVEPWMRSRLAAAGIDEAMARRIGVQFVSGPSAARGSNRFGKLLLADTENWVDDEARNSYRVALNQMVNRTVPTPTLGDTPNWMSTELGSLASQYKSFAIGALNRSLVSGLQEETRQFWYGSAMAVGYAMILNEVRSRLFYDRSTFDKPMTGVVMDAVDRSSILGYFSDVNRSIEVLTGHRAGVRPIIGADKARDESGSRMVGAVAGPFAGQATNALSVLGDFAALHPTARTMADARQLLPGQNIPYLDPLFDHLVSDGKRFPEKEKKGPRVNSQR